MANTPDVRETQAQSSQSTVANLASNKSTVNPCTSQTSETPSKGLIASADDQNSSPKSCENHHLSDADRAQELAGFGSWADAIPEFLEHIRETEGMPNVELELN